MSQVVSSNSQSSPSFSNLSKDFLSLDEEKWEGLDALVKAQPIDHGNSQLDRLTLSTFDLDKIQDVDLFGVDGDSRFSLYIKNLSPPKPGFHPAHHAPKPSNKENFPSNGPIRRDTSPTMPKKDRQQASQQAPSLSRSTSASKIPTPKKPALTTSTLKQHQQVTTSLPKTVRTSVKSSSIPAPGTKAKTIATSKSLLPQANTSLAPSSSSSSSASSASSSSSSIEDPKDKKIAELEAKVKRLEDAVAALIVDNKREREENARRFSELYAKLKSAH